INCLLRRTVPDSAPAGTTENAQRPPPPEVPATPESRHSSIPPPGHPRLSSPVLVTCLGELLLAGVGLNKSYTDAPVFDSSDRELYKDWKRAVLRKLKMSVTPSGSVVI